MVKTINHAKRASNPDKLKKCPTGIKGFDEIIEGGQLRHPGPAIAGHSKKIAAFRACMIYTMRGGPINRNADLTELLPVCRDSTVA